MARAEQVGYSAPAAACAADILKALASARGPMSLAEIERATSRTKSLVFRTLHELVGAQLVKRDDDRRYSLGILAFEVGTAYLTHRTNTEAVRDVLRTLSEAAGESTNLCVLRDDQVLYLMKFDGPSTYVTISRIGGRVPATCTASGKALLAELAVDEVRGRVSEPLTQMTPYSIAALSELEDDLAAIRQRGYARDIHEAVAGRAGIAMTVPFGIEEGHAAVSLSTDAGRFEREEDHLVDLLTRACAGIQRDVASREALGA